MGATTFVEKHPWHVGEREKHPWHVGVCLHDTAHDIASAFQSNACHVTQVIQVLLMHLHTFRTFWKWSMDLFKGKSSGKMANMEVSSFNLPLNQSIDMTMYSRCTSHTQMVVRPDQACEDALDFSTPRSQASHHERERACCWHCNWWVHLQQTSGRMKFIEDAILGI